MIKLIGCTEINITSWDGSQPIKLIVPNECNLELKQEIVDFVLGELDDHDGADALRELWDIDKIEDIYLEREKRATKEELRNQIMELAKQEVDAAHPDIDWSKMGEQDCSNYRKEIMEKAIEILLDN